MVLDHYLVLELVGILSEGHVQVSLSGSCVVYSVSIIISRRLELQAFIFNLMFLLRISLFVALSSGREEARDSGVWPSLLAT